jgi:phospholipid transport system transporter-binding protein
MNNLLTIVTESLGHAKVNGELTFPAIDKKALSSLSFLAGTKQVTIDLSGVTNADSAGLALLIEWIKHARTKRLQIRFKNIPEQLVNLAKLSGLDKADYFISGTVNQTASL